MAWSKEDLLEDLGIAPQNHKSYRKKKLHIDKGEIDPRSMGGIAVISDSNFDDGGILKDLNLSYWIVYPDNRYEKQNLIELETETAEDGKIGIKSLCVLGREVGLRSVEHIDTVLEAIRRIHVSLRDTGNTVPHIAKIFKDCMLEDIIGDRLALPGFDLDHRIYFSATNNFNITALSKKKKKPEVLLPLEAFLPLAGMRKNTLDEDHSYMGREFLHARGVIPQIGRRFEIRSDIVTSGKREKSREMKLVDNPVQDIAVNDNKRLIAAARWKVKKPGTGDDAGFETAKIRQMQIMGNNILRKGFHEVMAAIGVLNRTHTDMLHARDYPFIQDHLATYGLLDTASSSSNAPPIEGRFVMTSIGGNNLREIYPGVGEEIGGNCKVVETQWINKRTGETEKLGAIFDMGTFLIRKNSEWNSAQPDVVEKLKYCKDVFISHHHIDHIDALVPYIKRRLIGRSHTVHLTPEVYEMLNDKLVKMDIKKDDPRRPAFNLLQGTGVVDLRDDKGKIRMSVMYGTDAVPHSAKGTPYIAYGRNGKNILGSYMYLGDMRYDEDWLKDRKSKFWSPADFMFEREPDLNPEHLTPTYTELDATSAKRMGRGTNEKDVEKNLTYMLKNWFEDKNVGVSIIGTNDGRRETLLRTANNTQRNMTAFGAAVEFLFGVANKWGVNPYRLRRPLSGQISLDYIKNGLQPHQFKTIPSLHYTGIADYLSWHASKTKINPVEYKGRGSKKVEEWFDNFPGSLMAVLSGSQGNPIEFESMTYKLADGRSFWDANPQHSKTARPTDLKDWAIIFSQGAIPGNGEYQRKLISRLAGRGSIVVESFDDNIRIHNPGKLKKKIIDDLINMGKIAPGQESKAIEADGSIVIENFPIHASGHGRNGDIRLWLNMLQSKYFGMYHTDDRESVNVGYETIESEGKKHPGDIFENSVEVRITNDRVFPIGKITSSLVLTNEKSEPGKHYNKFLEATRIINIDERSPHHELGLRGSVGGAFEMHFGVEDAEDVRKRQKKFAKKEIPINRSIAARSKPRSLYRSMEKKIAPKWNPDHPGLSP